MSLQVWLPLNGNIDNQGLSNITTASIGTLSTSAGKIGSSSYVFNGSNGISINRQILPSKTPEWSFACWFYLDNTTSTTAACLFSERTGGNANGYTIFIYPNNSTVFVDDGVRWTIVPMTFSSATWYHFAVTRSTSGKKIYVNGELKSSTTTVGSTSAVNANGCTVGLAQSSSALATGNQGWIGRLNDVRIYNHCLSQKEVKEIAKGLILHHKLNSISSLANPNLLPDTNVNSLTKVVGTNNRYYESSSSGTYTATFESISDPPIQGINYGIHYTVTVASGFHGLTWYTGGLISVTDEPYTLSCYIKKISSGDVSVKFQYGKSPYVADTITLINDNAWHQYSWTFTPNTASGGAAASGTTRIYGAGPSTVGEIIVCGWKLEKGEQATRWLEYNTVDTPILCTDDVSGYNHAAIANSVEVSSDTARYGAAANFSTATSTFTLNPCFSVGQNINQMSVSIWFKTNTLNNTKPNLVSLGGNAFFRFRLESTTGLWYYIRVGSTQVSSTYSCKTVTDDSWHFYTITFNEGIVIVYLDGEQIGTTNHTSTANYLNCNNNVWVLAGYSNSSERYVGSLSDFRIYATALSAADVKELYNTSASIDHDGNIYVREFDNIDSSNRFQINHRGQMLPVDQFIEQNEKLASIIKNDDVLGGIFYEY